MGGLGSCPLLSPYFHQLKWFDQTLKTIQEITLHPSKTDKVNCRNMIYFQLFFGILQSLVLNHLAIFWYILSLTSWNLLSIGEARSLCFPVHICLLSEGFKLLRHCYWQLWLLQNFFPMETVYFGIPFLAATAFVFIPYWGSLMSL